MNNQQQNISLYYLKAFAIVFVALAHSCYTFLPNHDAILFFERLSRCGVFIFFFLAGYFFKPKQYFWKKKFFRLFLPWIIAAIWMYSYPQLLHNKIWSLSALINYFIGNGSYMYFLSMLVMCYIFCYPCRNNKMVLKIYVLLNIISILLHATKILPNEVYVNRWFFDYINPYLNIFNWLGIFALGTLFQKTQYLSIIQEYFSKHILFFAIITILSILILNRYDVSAMYWSYFALPLELLMMFVFSGLCLLLIKPNQTKPNQTKPNY